MTDNLIQINGEFIGLKEINDKLNSKNLLDWEQDIYDFILNWFNSPDFIIQKTSGSTGEPKEIKLKKSAMVSSAQKTIQFFNLQKNDTAWLCLPIHYIAGKMMVVRAITGKLNLIISAPTGTPSIPDSQITFTALVPLQLQKMIEAKSDLSQLKVIIVGGAAVNYALLNSIKKISPAVYATYGMTETCSHIALQQLNGYKPDNYFKTLEGISISTNQNNCLQIDAPHLVDKTLSTNDIVELVNEKEFKIIGRKDNIINSGGIKISPEILEKEISTILKKECLIVPEQDDILGQKLALVVEGKYDKLLAENIIMKINKQLGKHQSPKAVCFIKCFPRNNSMKIDRKAVLRIVSN